MTKEAENRPTCSSQQFFSNVSRIFILTVLASAAYAQSAFVRVNQVGLCLRRLEARLLDGLRGGNRGYIRSKEFQWLYGIWARRHRGQPRFLEQQLSGCVCP